MSKRNIIILAVVGLVGGTLALCLLCGLVGYLRDDGDQAAPLAAVATLPPLESAPTNPPPSPTPLPVEPTPTATPEPTPEPTATAAPVTPEDALRDNLSQALGETANRDDLPKVDSVSISLDVITIRWAIDDGFSNAGIRTGAQIDIKEILQVVAESGLPYAILNLEGTFSLVDALGNSSEAVVVWATYEPETISQINWPNFLHKNVYEIATTHKFHPAFEE